jgi:hypothetical protein
MTAETAWDDVADACKKGGDRRPVTVMGSQQVEDSSHFVQIQLIAF